MKRTRQVGRKKVGRHSEENKKVYEEGGRKGIRKYGRKEVGRHSEGTKTGWVEEGGKV